MNKDQLNGTFEGTDYTEHVTDTLRILIYETSDAPEQGFAKWEIQHLDDDLGWYRITGSPKRRYMLFDRALDLAREEAWRIQKELENPHKPNNWTMRGK